MGKHSKDWDSGDSEAERKANKKAQKKVAKVAKILGYSNDTNPFGDSNLLQPFVWGKKIEVDVEERERSKSDRRKKDSKKSGKKSSHRKSSKRSRRRDSDSDNSHNGSSDDESSASAEQSETEESKRLKLLSEIEKVRKRRQDRENELAEIERLRDEEQRLKEMASFGDWQRKEEEFHLEQTAERSRIRLCEYRELPIDRIAKNMLMLEAAERLLVKSEGKVVLAPDEQSKLCALLSLAVEVDDANAVIDSVAHNSQLMNELCEDIQQFVALYSQRVRHSGNKSTSALNEEHSAFWKALLSVARVQQQRMQQSSHSSSSSSATQLHESIASDVRDLLRGKTPSELNDLQQEIQVKLSRERSDHHAVDAEYWELLSAEIQLQRDQASLSVLHKSLLQRLLRDLSALQAKGILQDPATVKKSRGPSEQPSGDLARGGPVSADALAMQKYMRDMDDQALGGAAPFNDLDDSEAQMVASDEFALPSTSTPGEVYDMEDKYRPRKPRYFNRVKTGWDRTKYNLTHYDHDNPPPKVIQGYKFTLFYPDLIDKSHTPRFVLEPCPDCENNEFVIIRFTAGPPYEDVAFKIVNKEWEKHKRAGFVSVFDRGILQLHFNFKRAFYRR